MQGNTALMATVVGRSDAVGGDAANMRLSKQRADAVRRALLRTGKVTAQRIEERWTGERPEGNRPMVAGADASNRVVDIALH
jgi:outer membrane protein OmpA-like peptidoglycan-associated protein